MMRLLFILTLLAPSLAYAQITWRVSVKIFTDGMGNLPVMPNWWVGGATLFERFTNVIADANRDLDATGRGYRFQLTEIVTIPGATAPLPATTNSWFNLPVGSAGQDDLDAKARANAAAFAYRPTAINFYYVNSQIGPNGGYCAFPAEGQYVILLAPNSSEDVILHEAGHYFALSHTFDSQTFTDANGLPCAPANPCTCANLVGGDDGIFDTPLDNSCWSNRDQVAQAQYQRNYNQLNAGEQWFVDNTWLNIMSYHGAGQRLTDDQFDVITDHSNASRFVVSTGRTRFVNRHFFGEELGTSRNPFSRVSSAVNLAINGDIVLLRSANYYEPGTYTKPVTFRATRGPATIGIP